MLLRPTLLGFCRSVADRFIQLLPLVAVLVLLDSEATCTTVSYVPLERVFAGESRATPVTSMRLGLQVDLVRLAEVHRSWVECFTYTLVVTPQIIWPIEALTAS